MEDYAAIFRRNKRTFILLAILGPALGYLLCFVLPKEYTSQTVNSWWIAPAVPN